PAGLRHTPAPRRREADAPAREADSPAREAESAGLAARAASRFASPDAGRAVAQRHAATLAAHAAQQPAEDGAGGPSRLPPGCSEARFRAQLLQRQPGGDARRRPAHALRRGADQREEPRRSDPRLPFRGRAAQVEPMQTNLFAVLALASLCACYGPTPGQTDLLPPDSGGSAITGDGGPDAGTDGGSDADAG